MAAERSDRRYCRNSPNRSIVKEMKGRLNKEIVRILEEEDVPYIESGQFNIN